MIVPAHRLLTLFTQIWKAWEVGLAKRPASTIGPWSDWSDCFG